MTRGRVIAQATLYARLGAEARSICCPIVCNDYQQWLDWEQYVRAMAKAGLGMPADADPASLTKADDIRVGDTAPIMVAADNVVQLREMKWGLPPNHSGRAPVFNFRSEGRSFADSKRCLIPATAFFEFTGKQYPKSKWRFALRDGSALAIAGLWRERGGESYFTMLTTKPGLDVQPFHERQVAVLLPEQWSHWLYLERPEADILKPLPDGTLTVTLDRAGADRPEAELLSLAGTEGRD